MQNHAKTAYQLGDSNLSPKRAGGWGGGGEDPSTFRAIILLKSCATFGAIYFRENRSRGSKVTQHYVIERRLET